MAEGNFESDIKRMQDLFGTLKHEYDLYFAGTRKTQPVKERAEIERLVRYYSNGVLNKLSQQFMFNSFASKFSLHREQWNKWLKAKEEGLTADPRLAGSMKEAKRALYELEKTAPGQLSKALQGGALAGGAESAKAVPPGTGKSPRAVGQLYDEFVNAKLLTGMAPEWDYAAFEAHLKSQREAILAKYTGKDVIFTVQSQNGRVLLKAKVVK